jgi:hypothetical protein
MPFYKLPGFRMETLVFKFRGNKANRFRAKETERRAATFAEKATAAEKGKNESGEWPALYRSSLPALIFVPGTGFEPAHPCERCDLNTVRLPISPPGQLICVSGEANVRIEIQLIKLIEFINL